MAGKVPAADLLDAVIEAYETADWEAETLKETLRVLGEERFELKLGKAQAPVRVAVTGRTVGPPAVRGAGAAGPRRDAAAAAGGTSEALTCSAPAGSGIGWKIALGVWSSSPSTSAGTFVQVWQASRDDQAQEAGAIVVMGAAQYNGVPSPVFEARLDHGRELYEQGLSDVVVVTGGRQEGDEFSEAQAGALWLEEHGVPEEALRLEVQGRNSWESLAASARFLEDDGIDDVMIVSDPFHSKRLEEIASEVGLEAFVSPTDRQPGERRRRVAGDGAGDGRRVGGAGAGLPPPDEPGRHGQQHQPADGRPGPAATLDGPTDRGWCNWQHSWFWSSR